MIIPAIIDVSENNYSRNWYYKGNSVSENTMGEAVMYNRKYRDISNKIVMWSRINQLMREPGSRNDYSADST